MNLLVWNTRGLNDPIKQKEVNNRIVSTSSIFVGLLETRVKRNNYLAIVERMFPNWEYVNNYDAAVNGRIWLCWKPCVQVQVISTMDQCISALIRFNSLEFFCSIVYASNDQAERRRLWQYLVDLKSSIDDAPWMI